MAATKMAQRGYNLSSTQLFGICATALAQLGARIERHDIASGVIVAALGSGLLGPESELDLKLTQLLPTQTELHVTWRARKRGGDRQLLAAFMQSVEGLVAAAPSHNQL